MFKSLAIIISALFFVKPQPMLDTKLVQRLIKSSVVLHMKGAPDKEGDRRRSKCSCTYISPTQILTAAHCFDEKTEFVWARGALDRVGYPVKLVRIAKSRDLALLEAPLPSRHHVRLGAMPQQGDTVINVGSPLDFEYVVSAGIVGALNYKVKGWGLTAKYLVTTAMINPGSSGGGAFNERGELIGVNTMSIGMFGWSGISLAVSINDVKEFVK